MMSITEFKNPRWKKILFYICCFLALYCSVGIIFSIIYEDFEGIAFIFIIMLFSVYGLVKNGFYAWRVRKCLMINQIEGIEDDKSGNFKPFLVIWKNDRLGLFDTKTMKIVLWPSYLEIERDGKFFSLKNKEAKYGAFSSELKKKVVPCEYDYYDFSRSNCLRFAKESTIYKFSFSGELQDQHYYGEELARLVDGLSSEQLACLAKKKDY